MKKKEELLGTPDTQPRAYILTTNEKNQISALLELVNQARQAQDIIYTQIVTDIASRLEVSNSAISLNMEDIMRDGIDAARLVVK